MPTIGTREIIGAIATIVLLPVVFIVIGISFLWALIMIPILFALAVLLFKLQGWKVKRHIIEGDAYVIEEHLIERDTHEEHHSQ